MTAKIEKILRKNHRFWQSDESLEFMQKKTKKTNLKATFLSVDLSKAFNSILKGKMEQILVVYGLPNETVTTKNTKVKVCSPDGETDFFDIVAVVLQEDTLALYLFIICLD